MMAATDDERMVLGLSIRYLGYHAAGWRHPDADPLGGTRFAHFAALAAQAEEACIDMLFLADGIGIRTRDEPPGALAQSSQVTDLEPLTLLSALSAVTKRIGLVCTASTTYNEPFHIARKFASLDRISGGRAGWNIVTSWSDAEARNFGRERHLDHETRYARAMEFAEVVCGLWDSWGDGALLCDKETARLIRPEHLHRLDHRGPHFSVQGPLDVPRSPQGRPLLVQAGSSDAGIGLAARYAEAVYVVFHDEAGAKAQADRLRSAVSDAGRDPAGLKILAGITPFIGRTDDEARERYEALNDLIPDTLGLSYLYQQLGDLSGYPLDGPVPDPVNPMVRSMGESMVRMARARNLTIRQLARITAAGFGSHVVVGSAERIADEMESWFRSGAVDGFNLCLPLLPQDFSLFTRLVLPELRRRGLVRESYRGDTLRAHLGLPAPPSRYGDYGGRA
jgi:FMN-dependent oxidoreductase (nitrilotriacetate monooxygenase family)